MLDEVISSIYNRGIKDGSADVKMRVEGAYERGLEDAWECANKISAMTASEFEEVFGYSYYSRCMGKMSPSEAMQKIKEYEQQKQKCESCFIEKLTKEKWASAKDCKECKRFTDATDMNDGNIKVGDEVRIKGSDPVKDDCDYGICTRSLPNINTIYVMRRDGSSGEENKDEWYRTGRQFPQIAEVLEQLRGDKR